MRLTLVVAGVPRLAEALRATDQFELVHSVESTSGLKDLIGRGLPAKDALVFLFGDTLTEDTPGTTLPLLLQKLTTSGWRVIVVQLTPKAVNLVTAYPAAGLLPGPFTVNQAIGAIAGLPGVAGLGPVDDGFDVVDLHANAPAPIAPPAPVAPPASAAPASTTGGWSTPIGGWSTPEVAPVVDQPPATVSTVAEPPARRLTPPTTGDAPAAPRRLARPGGDTQSMTAPAGSGWSTPAANGADWETPPPVGQAAAPAGALSGPLGGPQSGAFTAWSVPTGAPVVPADPSVAPRRLAPPSGPMSRAGGFGVPDNGFAASAPALSNGFGGPPAARAGAGYGPQDTRPARLGRVITITAPKGGTGKSSLTLNLATYLGLRLRQQNKRVCVIDTNFQQADTGKYLDVYSPNITGIVRDSTALDPQRIDEYLVHRPDLSIHALLGPSTPLDANPVYINAKLYCAVLEALRELYDYILIDTPVAEKFHDIFTGFALPQADFIIVPVAPNIATLMNADSWLRAITAPKHTGGDGIDPQKIGIVLNRAKDNIDCSEDDVRQELSSWPYIGAIPETDEWQRCNNNNELVATKNYTELNEAFSRVLYAATGEKILQDNISTPIDSQSGLTRLIRRLTGKG